MNGIAKANAGITIGYLEQREFKSTTASAKSMFSEKIAKIMVGPMVENEQQTPKHLLFYRTREQSETKKLTLAGRK